MPAKSAKQYGLMQARAHGSPGPGPSPEVAKRFIEETPSSKRSEFAKHLRKKKR